MTPGRVKSTEIAKIDDEGERYHQTLELAVTSKNTLLARTFSKYQSHVIEIFIRQREGDERPYLWIRYSEPPGPQSKWGEVGISGWVKLVDLVHHLQNGGMDDGVPPI
jgi:hypothetical protein